MCSNLTTSWLHFQSGCLFSGQGGVLVSAWCSVSMSVLGLPGTLPCQMIWAGRDLTQGSVTQVHIPPPRQPLRAQAREEIDKRYLTKEIVDFCNYWTRDTIGSTENRNIQSDTDTLLFILTIIILSGEHVYVYQLSDDHGVNKESMCHLITCLMPNVIFNSTDLEDDYTGLHLWQIFPK